LRCRVSACLGDAPFRTAAEAFLNDEIDSFIPAELVLAAQKTEELDPDGPLVIACDPAGKGADDTCFAWRQGRVVLKTERRHGLSTMEIAGRLDEIIRKEKPDRVFIDITGMGVGVYDRLIEMGHGMVSGVNFASKPLAPPTMDEANREVNACANRRAEMWLNLKRALEKGRVKLPDTPSLLADLVSVGYGYTSSGAVLLESKEKMKARGCPSPDEGDAVALLFSEGGEEGIVRRGDPNFNRVIEYGVQGYV